MVRSTGRSPLHRDGLGISWEDGNLLDSGRNRHCLLDAISSDAEFDPWISRIECLPDFLIEEACHSVADCGAAGEEIEAAVGFLKYRRDSVRQLILPHRAQFTSITAWSWP